MPNPRLPVLKSAAKNPEKGIPSTSRASGSGAAPDPVEKENEELQRQLAIYKREWFELIGRVKLSTHFRGALDKCQLLDWFWERFPAKVTDADIEVGFFGNRQNVGMIDATRSRVALTDVRQRLGEFQAEERGEKWLLGIPKGKGGYRLSFSPANRPSSATHSFWNVHLRSFEDPVLITGSHLFFFDTKSNKIVRYYDFNVKGDLENDDILTALADAHPEESAAKGEAQTLEPWRDAYLANGDVCAHELFLRWFHRESESRILIDRKTSRQVTTSEVHRRNVILIGRPQTNPLIETLMKSEPQKSRFAFRIHPVKGALQVSNIKSKEHPELTEFPISSNGVMGPIWDEKRVFGLFTRFPNPGGRGYITIISCGHYAMVIARIVDAMTDETHAKELLRQMGWPLGEPLPDAFEMVFTVDIAPGGLEGEGFPRLILWRQC